MNYYDFREKIPNSPIFPENLYKNNIVKPQEFSNMSVADAKQDIKKNKNFLRKAEYVGLMNIIHSERGKKDLLKIQKLSPTEIREWLNIQIQQEKFIITDIWNYLFELFIPIDESFLLAELENVETNYTDDWVELMKQKGYFFSDKVYSQVLAKRKV